MRKNKYIGVGMMKLRTLGLALGCTIGLAACAPSATLGNTLQNWSIDLMEKSDNAQDQKYFLTFGNSNSLRVLVTQKIKMSYKLFLTKCDSAGSISTCVGTATDQAGQKFDAAFRQNNSPSNNVYEYEIYITFGANDKQLIGVENLGFGAKTSANHCIYRKVRSPFITGSEKQIGMFNFIDGAGLKKRVDQIDSYRKGDPGSTLVWDSFCLIS